MSPDRPRAKAAERLEYLDGLRGWMALVVVLTHIFVTYLLEAKQLEAHGADWLNLLFDWTPLGALGNGKQAVYIFFAISGVALSYPVLRSATPTATLAAMAAYRYPRLMIPMLVSCILAWLLLASGLFFNARAAQYLANGKWWAELYNFPPDFADMLTYALWRAFGYEPSSWNTVLWTMGAELNGSFVLFALLWIVVGYTLVVTVLVLNAGRLADMFGRTRTYTLGLIVFTVASAFCAIAPTALTLILGRVIQGVGGAFMFANSSALVTDAFPRAELGRALGLNAMVVGAGLILTGIICQIVQLVVSIRHRAELRDLTGDPWDGRSLEWATASPPPAFNFAVMPDVTGGDAYWAMKQHAREEGAKEVDYQPIEMPRNSPTGFVCAFFATVLGFALIWHIWWMVIAGLVGAYTTFVVFAWRDHDEYEIPAEEVARRGLVTAAGGA